MRNVRTLTNKIDELKVLTRTNLEFQQCSIMCLTETWLQVLIPDPNASLPGLQSIWPDREMRRGKRRGGGIAVLFNNRWCNSGHASFQQPGY